jgi:glyoxylase-like metal-dependent hydrolase (beta-lactamase superfamily II)
MSDTALPEGIKVFERGWLSANNIFFWSKDDISIVDTGYVAHQEQTLALVKNLLKAEGLTKLDKIVNTHLHSDHCGGNAILVKNFQSNVYVPASEVSTVNGWDENLLSFRNLGQDCPAFKCQYSLEPGKQILLGTHMWEILAAPGHDPHSIVLYQEDYQLLISADALWEDGFGAIFPELDGEDGFEEVAKTLDLIEQLKIKLVIPGHGKLFTDIKTSIARARSRLDYLATDKARNARHAAKVLLKFRLLEWQSIELNLVHEWIKETPLMKAIAKELNQSIDQLTDWLPLALIKAGGAKINQNTLINLD